MIHERDFPDRSTLGDPPRIFTLLDGMHGNGIGDSLYQPGLLARDQDSEAASVSRSLHESMVECLQSDPAFRLFLLEDPAESLDKLRRELFLPQIGSRLDNDRNDL
jgi:hypothetical protein